LPAAFIFFVGFYLRQKKFAYMMFGVMLAGLLLITLPIIFTEVKGNPALTQMGINNHAGNLEGKEVRFGTLLSAAYSGENMVIPAGTITGMHDSYMPLSGIFMLVGMQIDAFFGGVGSGFINFLVYLVTALFIATLMIGRTPEILGKKISIREMQIAVAVNFIQVAIPLILAALACFVFMNYPGGNNSLGWLSNHGPHGFTTFLYEYVSGGAGNGSNFGSLGNNTPFWNLTTSLAMLTGRFVPIVGMMMLVGMLQKKQYIEPSAGTLKTNTVTFGVYLFIIILLLNALCELPAYMLGPIADHLTLAH
jgi:K+-transporting ATPase ATPase A chain